MSTFFLAEAVKADVEGAGDPNQSMGEMAQGVALKDVAPAIVVGSDLPRPLAQHSESPRCDEEPEQSKKGCFTMPTTPYDRETAAWYLYDWAAACFTAVGITLFIPLMLNATAREHALGEGGFTGCGEGCNTTWCPNGTDPCFMCIPGKGDRLWSTPLREFVQIPDADATVWFIFPVSAFTFTSWVLSISVFFQFLTFLSCGPLADYGSNRRRMLLGSTVLGAGSTLAFMAVTDPALYWLAGVLAIVSNVFHGASSVFHNSYLPILVHEHPQVVETGGKVAR
ncbi:vacuole effluxer Atg22 like-domain-containing protein [Baffinella frigidus]|nr:vacuole effluxer Atg22 like-domain-containing protein [Cryptophyta sp. CCMP2293]